MAPSPQTRLSNKGKPDTILNPPTPASKIFERGSHEEARVVVCSFPFRTHKIASYQPSLCLYHPYTATNLTVPYLKLKAVERGKKWIIANQNIKKRTTCFPLLFLCQRYLLVSPQALFIDLNLTLVICLGNHKIQKWTIVTVS